ncbi:NF038132 family protein [Methylocella sp.]|uniref:NF038132 family protein n=1 Tax=Methylocella sp. TaxID=1978226 RepID=UPI0037844927
MFLAAGALSAASPAAAQICVGNCGEAAPNGVVTTPPNATTTPNYNYVSTFNGVSGAGSLPGVGGSNGSTFSSAAFAAKAGDLLKFDFNYVTSDGSGFADYSWAQLRTASGDVVTTLFTARTQPTGTIVPGFGLPGVTATLTPPSVPIIPGAPAWEQLGSSSNTCYAAGCGYTGWVNSIYEIIGSGNYVLVFGVTNWSDTAYQSGLAFAGLQINDKPIEGQNIDLSAPFHLASALGSTLNPIFQGGTLRMDQKTGLYALTFTLDNSGTNTIDQFGSTSIFASPFVDAVAGTPGGINIVNTGAGGSVTFASANTYTGATNIAAGATLIVSGSISNASSINNAGAFETAVSGVVNVADVANSGTVSNLGTLTASNAIVNAGLFIAGGSVTTPLFQNTGVFSAPGALGGTIGTFQNAGVLSLVNNKTTDVFSPANYVGQGGAFAIDVNVNGAGQRADLLKVGTFSGSTTLQLNSIGAAGLIATPIPVVSAANVAPGASLLVGNNPGIVNYEIEQSGNTFNLISTLNTSAASAAPSGIDAMLSALNTGFFQNASAFISEPVDPEPNRWNGGPWIRVANGRNDVTSTATAFNPNGAASSLSEVRADFDGFQTGVDLGVANIQNSGWNTHLGVTAGQVGIRTFNLIGPSSNGYATVPFVGLYAAVTGHNFFADVQIRKDFLNLSLNTPLANLSGASTSGGALGVNGSLGYRIDLPNNYFFEPSLAFIYSKLYVDDLPVPLGPGAVGTLQFNPFESALGRVGVRVGTTYVFDQAQLALQPFLTGSVWHEFAGDTYTDFSSNGVTIPLSVTRIGTFGQVGFGVSGQILKTGLLGFVRGDYRFSSTIEGYGVVGGMRYQF